MPENFVEKKFLYLILFSFLLHAAFFTLLLKLPAEKKQTLAEPFMVDLQDIADINSVSKVLPPPTSRQGERRLRVPREIAPKGDSFRELTAPPKVIARPLPLPPPSIQLPGGGISQAELPKGRSSSREELFREQSKEPSVDVAKLYPDADRLARLEENYRKKYGPEVADGETSFLNTDDFLFGSFLRRLETAVYGVWRYPDEAVRMGIEGVTPVRITFNRKGEIVERVLLHSSGSAILDSEVLRTLDQIGVVGALPRNYDKDRYNLIAFFHYGILQGARRSLR